MSEKVKMWVTNQLISAISRCKDNDEVFRLLEIISVDEINQSVGFKTALGTACHVFNHDALDRLLSKDGIDVNVKDSRPYDTDSTPLHVASSRNNLHAVSRLLAVPEVEVNPKFYCGETPLHTACTKNFLQVVQKLLSHPHIDVNAESYCGYTPLHVARHHKVVLELLASPQINVNAKNVSGETALHLNMNPKLEQSVQIFEELLACPKIDVNAKTIYGKTPLHIACENNFHDVVVKLLSKSQIDVNSKTNGGETPLHSASRLNRHQIVAELLARKDIQVNIQDEAGETTLHKACENNSSQTVSELLSSPGIQVNVRNLVGLTPIMWAARRCHVEAMELMLSDARVDLDTEDGDGWGLEMQVGVWCGEEESREKCFRMIEEERKKRGTRQVEQQQTSKDGSIGGRIEKVDTLKKELVNKEGKLKNKLLMKDYNIYKNRNRRTLKERQSLEKQDLIKKHMEEEATLRKKHEDEQVLLIDKHDEEENALERIIAKENEVKHRHITLLKERREKIVCDLQKQTVNTFEDRVKLEDAENKLEAARNVLMAAEYKQEATEKTLECPVCMELMRPPTKIWMCRNSHLICEPCRDGMDVMEGEDGEDLQIRGKCPTCTTEPVTLRAFLAENFARTVFN